MARATGNLTRQDRLQVAQYNKPLTTMEVEIADNHVMDNHSETSRSSLV